MQFTKKYLVGAAAVVATSALVLTACSGEAAPTGPEEVKVGIIYSETGALSAYGAAYRDGFEIGLDYITKGTGEINGTKIAVTFHDDGGDPDKATTAAKGLIGEGYKILGGTASSAIAIALSELAGIEEVLYIAGPAATDAYTGANKYTFRSGRQTLQDVATAGTFLEDIAGKNVIVYGQDTAFGQGNVAAVKAILGAKQAVVSEVLVPENATDFTPFSLQLKNAKPDLVFVAWAGASSGAMWQSLSQQQVFENTTVVTGLGDVATYNAFGEASDKISFLNHYFAGATNNEANKALVDGLAAKGKQADLFSPDGFNAAIMFAHAIEKGGDDVEAYVEALKGWSFEGPKGTNTIRAEDNALLQDMFRVKLVKSGDNWVPELLGVSPAAEVAPPLAK